MASLWTEWSPFRPYGNQAANDTAYSVLNGRFYVAGGSLGTGAWRDAFSYDHVTNTWTTLPLLIAGVYGATGAAVNGKFYVIGGRTAPSNAINLNQALDIAAGTWSQAAVLPASKVGRTSMPSGVINGKIYVTGGEVNAETWEYNPATNAWTRRADCPVRHGGSGCGVVFDGKLWAVGGVDATTEDWATRNQIHVYDPAANSWATKTPAPSSVFLRPNSSMSIATDNAIHSVWQTANHWKYNPTTEAWTREGEDGLFTSAIMDGCFLGDSLYVSGGQSYSNKLKRYEVTIPPLGWSVGSG